MDRGTWRATVHRVAKSWARLKQLGTHDEAGTLIRRWWEWHRHDLSERHVECQFSVTALIPYDPAVPCLESSLKKMLACTHMFKDIF